MVVRVTVAAPSRYLRVQKFEERAILDNTDRWAIPCIFLFIFGGSKQTLQFLQQTDVKKCPSSIPCQVSNPQPLERESLPITTRPGLPPNKTIFTSNNVIIYPSIIFIVRGLAGAKFTNQLISMSNNGIFQ